MSPELQASADRIVASVMKEIVSPKIEHIAKLEGKLTQVMLENEAYIRRTAELVDALERQLENMSFVLNHLDLHAWHGKFESEMVKDRELLRL